MKQNWLRLIVSAMVIIAALSGAASSFVGPVGHSCEGMSAIEDCPDHPVDHSAALRHCDSLICGAIQLAPHATFTQARRVEVGLRTQVPDDATHRGVLSPPGLRPPIF
ncbi:hypothetical protein [Methylocystis sp.]|uniref:hypothetical protein n=1 Tax=Methylocystis sp. TaxID=1911079 RepID=UPI003DA5D6ED